jgi:large subunit ribosomal protein L18
MEAAEKRLHRVRRHKRVRRRVSGSSERPRLAVYRSNRHIYAQLIDDVAARTVAAASDRESGVAAEGNKTAKAKAVGQALARSAREAGIEQAVFDRGGRLYQGRVAAVAEGAREGGLTI